MIVTISTLVGVVIGHFWGVYSASRHFRNLVDTFSSMRMSAIQQDAYDAYRNESPEIGVWALNAVVKDYERLIENGTDGLFYTAPGNYADLMLTLGRLALLYERTGNTHLAGMTMAQALEVSTNAYPSETISEATLREMISRLDEAANQRFEGTAVPRTVQPSPQP
jgi:hypothetical protein